VNRAGHRVAGGGVCPGRRGLGAEAFDDDAGRFGARPACFGEGEPVLVDEHNASVGAGEKGDDRGGAARFDLAGSDLLDGVLDCQQAARPTPGPDLRSETAPYEGPKQRQLAFGAR
jgi:hypothetical protein